MTAVLTKPAEQSLPGGIPGWRIVVDLTPPELGAARRLRTLKKLIVVGLAAVVALCAAGYVWAWRSHSRAEDAVTAAGDRTSALTAERARYSAVTKIQSMTQTVQAELGGVMAGDVDVPNLLARLRASLPPTMSLASMNITLTPADASSATPTLDTSGRPHIGSVTITGSAERMEDVALYVAALSAQRGLVNVVPNSNTAGSAGGSQWSITLELTDQLLSHRYDVTGGSH